MSGPAAGARLSAVLSCYYCCLCYSLRPDGRIIPHCHRGIVDLVHLVPVMSDGEGASLAVDAQNYVISEGLNDQSVCIGSAAVRYEIRIYEAAAHTDSSLADLLRFRPIFLKSQHLRKVAYTHLEALLELIALVSGNFNLFHKLVFVRLFYLLCNPLVTNNTANIGIIFNITNFLGKIFPQILKYD